eukprot:s1174_g5.t1
MMKQSRVLRVAMVLIWVTVALHCPLFAVPTTEKEQGPSPPGPARNEDESKREPPRLEPVEPSVPDYPFGLLSVVVKWPGLSALCRRLDAGAGETTCREFVMLAGKLEMRTRALTAGSESASVREKKEPMTVKTKAGLDKPRACATLGMVEAAVTDDVTPAGKRTFSSPQILRTSLCTFEDRDSNAWILESGIHMSQRAMVQDPACQLTSIVPSAVIHALRFLLLVLLSILTVVKALGLVHPATSFLTIVCCVVYGTIGLYCFGQVSRAVQGPNLQLSLAKLYVFVDDFRGSWQRASRQDI